MDVSYDFAKHVVKTTYDTIPGEAIEVAKWDILDTLGVAVAGSIQPGGKEIMELVGEWGGKGESTVIMFSKKVPAPFATLVNSTMAHALDYDDTVHSTGHVGASVIPAALAIAERKGKVSGKDFLAAVNLGIDVEVRLGDASIAGQLTPGWLYTSVYGYFGATVSAGKLLALNEEQMVNALGIAYAQAAGNFQCIEDGALSKRMQPGFASKGGVLSALMASKGLTGSKNTFQGKCGLFPLYHRNEYNPARLTAELGKRFAIAGLSIKLYPCCGHTHTAIDATLALAKEHNIAPDDVEEVIVHVSELARHLSEPLAVKQEPRVFVDAQFSIPWVVATALIKRKVTIEDFTPEAITNPAVLRLAKKVKPQVNLEITPEGTSPSRVEIKMKSSGAVYSGQEDIAKGHPKKPISWEELTAKFRDCASCGRKKLSNKTIERLIKTISQLERVDDVAEIVRLLG